MRTLRTAAIALAFTAVAALSVAQHASFEQPKCTDCKIGNCPPPTCNPSSGNCTLCRGIGVTFVPSVLMLR